MEVSEAKQKVCPLMSDDVLRNCICEPCMFWVNTVKGKKEIARKKIPYDLYSSEEGQLRRQLERDGYEEHKLDGDWRSTYIKYEEAQEGYCARIGQ